MYCQNTNTSLSAWLPIIGTLLGIIFGFLLNWIQIFLSRRKRLSTLWASLLSDLEICKEKGQMYLDDKIMAPLYRLPTEAFIASIPLLFAEGAILQNEFSILSKAFSNIKDFNRGLDIATDLLKSGAKENDPTLQNIYSRNLLYAKILIPNGDKQEIYTDVYRVIENNLNKYKNLRKLIY